MDTDARKKSEEYQETEEERRMRDERFVEKFFTERELIVNFDDTSKSDEENAQTWYEAVGKTMNTLNIYKHDNVGQPLDDAKSDVWFFRGQKDARFAFTSTLYRRLSVETHHEPSSMLPDEILDALQLIHLINEPWELEIPLINAEIDLLNKAREIGIGRGLTALETLTLLQHHGSPTRLIDITSDWKVALFFACESDQDRDGRIFLIRTKPDGWKLFPREKSKTKQAKHLIWEHFYNIDENESLLGMPALWGMITWPILLPFSDPRMISQRGFFLVGGIPYRAFANYLLTSKCPDCNNNRCECPDHKVESQSITGRKEGGQSFDSPLTGDELRKITSLAIQFEADEAFLDRVTVTNTEHSIWHTVGYSIRVPKEYKRTLIDILYREDVHKDSMYPPLRETVRLFEHVVDESFKK